MKKNSIAMVMVACGLYCGAAANLGASPLAQATSEAGSKRTDREIMQKIRKAVIADKTLSTFAHNVKIVARDGKVTLRGPVRSEAEKQTVAEMAVAVVGAGNVTNEMTIQPAK